MNNLAIIYQFGDEEEGVQKNVLRAIELYEKAIEFGESYSLFNLALIYEFGNKEEKIDIDINRACSLFFQRILIDEDEKSKNRFEDLILKHQNQVVWRKDYHLYWKTKENKTSFNQKIILLLLISKHKKDLKNKNLNFVFVRGITIEIIKYFCHFSS